MINVKVVSVDYVELDGESLCECDGGCKSGLLRGLR